MNELTKKLQQVMVPKAALIAYEYSDGRYGHGTYYLELHPINDRGRMEAAVPVTYEFMDSLVEYYTDNRQDVPHGKIPANMLWCDTRKGHERYIWYNPPGKRQMFFSERLNIPDGTFHVPGVGTSHRNHRKIKEFIFLIINYLNISYFLYFCHILPIFRYSVHF